MTAPDTSTTTADERPGEWISLAPYGFSRYEVYRRGGYGRDQKPIRSIDRTNTAGQEVKGQLLAVRPATNGYLQIKLYNDRDKQETRTVHSLILLANVGPLPPGLQTRHLDNDPWNNRWAPGNETETKAAGGNLIYGTPAENAGDKIHRGPAPRPVRHCILCTGVVTTNGRRCHDCVVKIGVKAAAMLRAGYTQEEVAEALDYPSTSGGVVTLAIRYGRYGQSRTRRWRRRISQWFR